MGYKIRELLTGLLFYWGNADVIRMVLKYCKCHEVQEEHCQFIRTLRELKAHKFAESMTEERVVPDVRHHP